MKKTKKSIKRLYRLLLIVLLTLVGLLFFLFIKNFLDIHKVSQIPQSTIIKDRTGKELFRFFEEDRHRLTYEEISPHMIDAIVAVEDQTFWLNNGTDKSGLMRAIWANSKIILGQEGQVQGGSTITQQLVKNIYLTKEKTISRKIQELVLAWQLTKKRTHAFAQEGFSEQDAQKKAKESIVTAYLNYVFFGNRSYGIDAASRHYFQREAKDLTVIQSAILAALPQAPSIYNPSVNQKSIMGYWTMSSGGTTGSEFALNITGSAGLYSGLLEKSLDIKSSCLPELIVWAHISSGDQQMTYIQGRKDRVLCRLWEMNKLDDVGLKEAFLAAKDISFYKPKYTISAPHFVFWIQKKLLELPIFTQTNTTYEQLSQGGYTVITTLDSDLQTAAEDAIANYQNRLYRLGGNNRAMLHIKSTNGDVLTYVGSADFTNDAIDGQVDVLRSIRQVGSTLKPFFYAYLFEHYPFTIQGNIIDYPLPKDSPQNHDGLFWGKTSIATALAGSRNLPVVRIFMALGGAKVFVPYLQSLGFTSLDPEHKDYSYPLALGADEATLLQLASAYVQLSVTGEYYPEINPIQRIIAPDGTIIYEKPASRFQKIIPDTVAEMIWRILENPSNMPLDWRWLRNLPIQQIALKTGTSDIKVRGRPYPRDGVSVVYTPTDIVVSRAGNTDGKAMGSQAFGGEINHYPLREYLQAAVNQQKIIEQPRITQTDYASEGRYAKTDHTLTREQELILWRAQ